MKTYRLVWIILILLACSEVEAAPIQLCMTSNIEDDMVCVNVSDLDKKKIISSRQMATILNFISEKGESQPKVKDVIENTK